MCLGLTPDLEIWTKGTAILTLFESRIMELDQMEKELKQLKRHLDQMHSQNVQKFTQIRRKRQEMRQWMEGNVAQFNEVLDEIEVRLDTIERALNLVSLTDKTEEDIGDPTPPPFKDPPSDDNIEAGPQDFPPVGDAEKLGAAISFADTEAEGGADE